MIKLINVTTTADTPYMLSGTSAVLRQGLRGISGTATAGFISLFDQWVAPTTNDVPVASSLISASAAVAAYNYTLPNPVVFTKRAWAAFSSTAEKYTKIAQAITIQGEIETNEPKPLTVGTTERTQSASGLVVWAAAAGPKRIYEAYIENGEGSAFTAAAPAYVLMFTNDACTGTPAKVLAKLADNESVKINFGVKGLNPAALSSTQGNGCTIIISSTPTVYTDPVGDGQSYAYGTYFAV